MSFVELIAVLLAATAGCALAWFELGKDRPFLSAATVLIAATFIGGAIAVVIS